MNADLELAVAIYNCGVANYNYIYIKHMKKSKKSGAKEDGG